MRRSCQRKERVGVVYGGISAEREVSLKSGVAVAEALGNAGYPVDLIDLRDTSLGELTLDRMDVAFNVVHGTFGEDGGLQSVLEVLGVPYTHSGVTASRLAMDKSASKACFRRAGLPTPASVEIEAQWASERRLAAAALVGFPAVVKPASQGSSVGVNLVWSNEELNAAIAHALEFDERAIVEEFIPGRELTVGILGDRPLPIVELLYRGPIFTWNIKYTAGQAEHIINPALPHGLADHVAGLALRAHSALGCRGCSRVDLRLDRNNEPFILEVNTIPGMTGTSLLPDAAKAAGISFTELCVSVVEAALGTRRRPASRRLPREVPTLALARA